MTHSPRHARIDWDDLRYALAVAESGSLAGAARTLEVNHTTVLRRINAFEDRLGLRLFERVPTGYVLTAGGEELLATARGMAEVVIALERKLAGQDLRLEGSLRVTTTDTLMAGLLPSILARFGAAYPGIALEVSVANAMANLTRRDADIAIRPALDPPETLIGRRVAALAFAVYGRAGAERLGDGLAGRRWIGPDDSLAGSAAARWMRRAVPEADIILRADSLLTILRLAEAGAGLALLPCYLGDPSPLLHRLASLPPAEIGSALWLLTHADLRRTARVRAFLEFMAEALAHERPLLEGRKVPSEGQQEDGAAGGG